MTPHTFPAPGSVHPNHPNPSLAGSRCVAREMVTHNGERVMRVHFPQASAGGLSDAYLRPQWFQED